MFGGLTQGSSIFGGNAPANPPTTPLFGHPAPAPTAPSAFSLGGQSAPFGAGFGQPPPSSNISTALPGSFLGGAAPTGLTAQTSQPVQTGIFGQQAPSTSLFGSTGNQGFLGSAQPQPQQQQQTGIFGQTGGTSAFPSTSTASFSSGLSTFGGTQQQPAVSGGLFAGTGNLTGGFSSALNPTQPQIGGNLFQTGTGTSAPQATGVFGNVNPTMGTAMGNTGKGTAGVQFREVTEDGTSNKYVHILRIDHFINTDKSIEEIRFEDYQLRKAGQLQFKKTSGTMGMPANTGLFSSTATAPTSNISFTNPGGLFSSSTNTGTGLGTGLGVTTSQPLGGGIFGTSSSQLTPVRSQPSSLFSAMSAPAPATVSGGLFGPTPGIGGNPTGQPSLFSTQPAPSLFSTQTQPSLGGAQPSLFPSTSPALGGAQPSLFSTQTPSLGGTQPGLFNTQPQQQQPSLFSNTTPLQGSSSTITPGQMPLQPIPPITNSSVIIPTGLPPQISQYVLQPIQKSSQTYNIPVLAPVAQEEKKDPYGPIKSYFTGDQNLSITHDLNYSPDKFITPYDNSLDLMFKSHPAPYLSNPWKLGIKKPLDTNLENTKKEISEFPQIAKNIKQSNDLILKSREKFKKLQISQPEEKKIETQADYEKPEKKYDENTIKIYVKVPNKPKSKKQPKIHEIRIHNSRLVREIKEIILEKLSKKYNIDNIELLINNRLLLDTETIKNSEIKDKDEILLQFNLPKKSLQKEIVKPESVENSVKLASLEKLPILTKKGYKTVPDNIQISRMSEAELKEIQDFTVENEFGKIVFEGKTDITGLNLDEIIDIRPKEIIVYPEDKFPIKPQVGEQLNKSATISLYKCFPNGDTSEEYKMEKFIKRLERAARKQNARHISYDKENGTWIFHVEGFK